MDPSDFFTAARVLIVAGKGGVGKTTVAATLGVAAARVGIDTLLVEIEGKRGLAALFEAPGGGDDGAPLTYDDTELIARSDAGGRLRARTIMADSALMDYLVDNGLKGFARTLTKLQVLDTLANSTPGLKDLIVMGKIKQLELARDAELIIVDAPASGHAISFLRAARGLQQTVHTGPIRRQADDVVALLTDPERAQVLLVTLAEETPVNELIETAYALEDDVGIRLGPAIVNAVYPDRGLTTAVSKSNALDPDLAIEAAGAATYWVRRSTAQAAQAARLGDELPLEQIALPRRLRSRLDRGDVEVLADELLEAIAGLRFEAGV
jgi:anion-transporting  ArsA/GET3 family ATPase